ncbi:hypothetical protein KJ940_09095 [Myxococcota bacterium]|nr:hypothetical protein [Myxococcota bacterium]
MRVALPPLLGGLPYDGTAATLAPLLEALNADPRRAAAPWWRAPSVGDGPDLLLTCAAAGLMGLRAVTDEGARLRCGGLEAPAADLFEAAHLFEALPLRPRPGEPAVDEACFLVARDAPAADALVERLLRLNRGDARVGGWRDEAGRAWMTLRLSKPPLYALMRARDVDEGVSVYARLGDGRLWIAWGWAHPLADVAAAWLSEGEGWRFVEPSGRWRALTEVEVEERGLYALVEGQLPAPRRMLHALDTPPRFQVQLRLEPGPLRAATLWLIDAADLLRLEQLIEQTPPKALGRLTIRGFVDEDVHRYVIKERVHGEGQAPLGPALCDLLGHVGYTATPGLDTLYLPADRRLAPQLSISALRGLFELDRGAVILTHDPAEGLRVLELAATPEAPLSRWVDFVLLAHRARLEAFMEAALFELRGLAEPGLVRASPPPPPKAQPTKPKPKRAKPRQASPQATAAAAVDEDTQALFAATLPLKAQVQAGGCADPAVWLELGALLARLNELEDAAACLEAGLFYGPRAPEVASTLAALRARGAGIEDEREAHLELATREHLSPHESGYVGARLIADLLSGAPVLEGLTAQIEALFDSPAVVQSTRLDWMTRATGALEQEDKLALTRAKEQTLGRLNAEGLKAGVDAPRFVQVALALDGASPVVGDQGQGLKALWAQLAPTLEVLEVQSALYRAIFAVGFARVGALDLARRLTLEVEEELPVHDPPVRAALRAYLAQLTEARDVELGPMTAHERRAFDVLRHRSGWLGEPPVVKRTPARWIEALLADQGARPSARLAEILSPTRPVHSPAFDWERAWSGRSLLKAALRLGDEAEIEAMLPLLRQACRDCTIPAHQAEIWAEIVTAAAALDDSAAVDQALDALAALAEQMRVGDLLKLLTPTLAALRRVGAASPARAFFERCARVEPTQKGAVALRIFIADGYALLGDAAEAEALLNDALRSILDEPLDLVTRYEAARRASLTLQGWAPSLRLDPALRLLARLDLFRDVFSSRVYFDAHKVLLIEHLVEALSDNARFKNRQVQLWLELEEQAIRRQLLADWRCV